MRKMEKIVIFGKGGIGKSTLTANLAVVYARQGLKVAVVGCDPKHDTTISLMGGKRIPTVVEHPAFLGGGTGLEGLMSKGVFGIDCVEAGGPEPGIGCAGRGIARMSELLDEAKTFAPGRYDVVLFDVLGDVVCGGFAAPLRQGFAEKVVIVASEELMALYAANNIARAVRNYASNGIALAGLVANLRDPGADRDSVSRFAGLIGTGVISFLPREPALREAEYLRKTVVDYKPECEISREFTALARHLLETPADAAKVPTPLSDEEFQELSEAGFRRTPRPAAPQAPAAPSTPEETPKDRHWVRLTRLCNQRCLFCLDRDAQNGVLLSVVTIRRDLEEGRERGLRRVVLSGGEATIHPQFVEIVALAKTLGYDHVQTITNGRRFCYPAFMDAAVAAGLKEITFSLHGHTAELHDRLTRVPGSFVQAVAGLRRALATDGLIVSVDVVINALNLPVLREHLDFCIGLGVREFDLLALVPFSDAWRNREELFCDFDEPANRAHLRRALELSRRSDLHVWTNRLRAEHLEGFESLIQPPEKIYDELRGRRAFFRRRLKGKPMPCEGEACAECFLRDFCGDLGELLEKKELAPRRGPLCRPELAPPSEPFRFGPAPEAAEFAAFYIPARYFAKGEACAGCADAKNCDGLPVEKAKAHGFSVLKVPRG